ncbi:hypothetical protein DFH28DRAFT_930294 [Melampsora americana]|nr:hypothetical protein DFH28DRAFT_930294 [Melampsora americana]
MLVVLCHLGDSPMHAEITNTVNPTITLNPSRVCSLKVDEMEDKKSEEFLEGFMAVDQHGQSDKGTMEVSLQVWTEISNQKLAKEWGIRDSLNAEFIKRIGEMHSDDSPLEEIYESWLKIGDEMSDRLFNPFLRLNGAC